ncbi:winged helix-turn-helix domain-containing protein [Aeoliella mucimassa]|uniref:Winged helix-turn-helix domain-containing protein n=1 Tax=Aeoliella mucimassa TaxID=2527972 RepID=A0A518ATV5_9BACT|nr:winged helix-turn-helix domain-containing protein [Aeoliella mucimassa]QDU58162.1 hypothetical protein Pan181_43890 [Aeoliella mucimassa]
MAKKTAASKTTPAAKPAPAETPAAAAKPTPAPKKAAPKKKAAASKAKPVVLMTSDHIGHTAGDVWKALAEQGPQTATSLKKLVDAPGDTVIAAVGWLAREGKLDFVASGRVVKIALR